MDHSTCQFTDFDPDAFVRRPCVDDAEVLVHLARVEQMLAHYRRAHGQAPLPDEAPAAGTAPDPLDAQVSMLEKLLAVRRERIRKLRGQH